MTTAPQNPVEEYARDVVDGKIPAGQYHRLACVRHLRDLERQGAEGFPFVFSMEHADRFLRFARRLKHYKGRKWAGQFFAPSPCQVFRLGCIFGWRHAITGLRRFTTAYNELPRKSGKTFEAAIVAIYCTFFEGEMGAEGYCIATKYDQAKKLVFADATRLVKSSGLARRIKTFAAALASEATHSKFEPLGSDSKVTDGLNASLIITDELHAFKVRGLLDVMESSTGARQNPMHFQITTAGDNLVSPCGDQHQYATKILDEVFEDDATHAFFAFIAHADKDDDWLDERTWRKASPHFGLSIEPDEIRKMALKAKNMPSAAAEFKQKMLNLWDNGGAHPCLSLDGWRAGQLPTTPAALEAQLVGCICYLGIDLASKIDLCALSALFPPTEDRPRWTLLQKIWTPKDTLADRAHRDRAPYETWVDQGWLTTVPGTSIDHEVVRQQILAWRDRFDLQQLGFDPWHGDMLIKNLVKLDGFSETQVVEVPQTYAHMSSACLRMQADILAGQIDAGGCPVTAWAVSNTVDQRDGKDNMMFIKKKSRGRIDPIIAATIAKSLAIRQEGTAVAEDPALVIA